MGIPTSGSRLRASYSAQDLIKLRDHLRSTIPTCREHVVFGFKFDWDWAFQKALRQYGNLDTGEMGAGHCKNIHRLQSDIMHESGIAEYLHVRLADASEDLCGMTHLIIGIAENRRGRHKIPPTIGIRKLMDLLETNEPPKWYRVSTEHD
ncbi:hypothetical protein SCHPADRAFT_905304 [Schizopora paradoxa]|uniref:Uncharacterized protein n=1 Tax=Schizopora paradoxa TaxID=27342 RepID=A0A0H2RKX5_9AGAM|nr:hypothetical protein SCHPADRAFT_905304 [Schizopora paradoxa]